MPVEKRDSSMRINAADSGMADQLLNRQKRIATDTAGIDHTVRGMERGRGRGGEKLLL